MYRYDIIIDIVLLQRVFNVSSTWPRAVLLLTVMSVVTMVLHYVVAAGVLAWHFVAQHRYLPLLALLLVPIMPVVDTCVVLVVAVQHAKSVPRLQRWLGRAAQGVQWGFLSQAVLLDWQGLLQLRYALGTLLQSIPMAILQSAIFVLGNSPQYGVYLDTWLYVASAVGSCAQILRLVVVVLWTAAKEKQTPWQALVGLLVLQPVVHAIDKEVRAAMEEL